MKCECGHYNNEHKESTVKSPGSGCLQSGCKCRSFLGKQYRIADLAEEGCEGCQSGCCDAHRVTSREWYEDWWTKRQEATG